jgi:hypothetical protein
VQFGPPQQVFAGVAQWLEQILHKDKATGSSPVTGIKWGRSAAWSARLPVTEKVVGSNPIAPAN